MTAQRAEEQVIRRMSVKGSYEAFLRVRFLLCSAPTGRRPRERHHVSSRPGGVPARQFSRKKPRNLSILANFAGTNQPGDRFNEVVYLSKGPIQ
jgi:hypothetical protein